MTQPRFGADAIVASLKQHGVDKVFGIPGDKIDRLFEKLEHETGAPELIVTRHEQNAAFMAQAYARLTDKTGVVVATSGPGVGNLATGLMTAQAEGNAVLAIGGQVQRKDLQRQTHQSTPSVQLMAPITNYSAEIQDPANIEETLANAFAASQGAKHGAAFVSVPQDIDDAPTDTGLPVYQPAQAGPAPLAVIKVVAKRIKAAQFPVLLVGLRGSAPKEAAALHALLAQTGLPVVETFQAAGVVTRELAPTSYFGRIGLFRNQIGDRLLRQSDLVVTIGYDAIEYEPRNWNAAKNATIVNLDTIPAQIDNYFAPVAQLIGEIAQTLTLLTSELPDFVYPAAAKAQLVALKAELEADQAAVAPTNQAVSHPLAVVQALQKQVSDDMIVSVDVGSHYIWMARYFRSYQARHLLFSNGMQTLGEALPWAMVAAMLHPEQKAVAVCGDGGFLYSGAELTTAVQHQFNLVTIVWNDGGNYDMVRFQEELKYGQAAGTKFGDLDIVKFAESTGATGLRVQSPDQLDAVLAQAFATDGPVVVDVPVDYSGNQALAQQLIDSQLG
ncbi:acetolactate synthase AlsS [Limosilactobacillus ingluviei]|nr:acetolactate synthase AlsS [Limosilactobacillus ingluviei]